MANVRICLVSSPTPFTPKPGMKEELPFCLPKVGPTTPTLGTEAPRYFHSRGSFLAFHCCTKTSQENRTKNPQGGCSISPQERWMDAWDHKEQDMDLGRPRSPGSLPSCPVSESAGPAAASFCALSHPNLALAILPGSPGMPGNSQKTV